MLRARAGGSGPWPYQPAGGPFLPALHSYCVFGSPCEAGDSAGPIFHWRVFLSFPQVLKPENSNMGRATPVYYNSFISFIFVTLPLR